LGSIGADEDLEREVESRFDEDDQLFLSFTVTERLVLDVSAVSSSGNTGDINLRISSGWDSNSIEVEGMQRGDDHHLGVPLEPGTYLIELWAAADLPNGFTLTLSSHGSSCGDSVVVPGLEACDDGGSEGCVECEVSFGWDCGHASPSVCTAIPVRGPYAAGEPIEPMSEPQVKASSFAYWMLVFAEDVWLSGTAVSQGDPEYEVIESISVWSEDQPEDQPLEFKNLFPPGEFGEWFLPAGTYKIGLRTPSGLDYGYVLSLSTTDNPAP